MMRSSGCSTELSDDLSDQDKDREHVIGVRLRHFKRWNQDLFVAQCDTCFWQGEPKESNLHATQNGAWHLRDNRGHVEPYDPLAD